MFEISVIKLNSENFMRLSFIDIRNMRTKMAKKNIKRRFGLFLLCYYETIMERRRMKFWTFSIITDISNILIKIHKFIKLSTFYSENGRFLQKAYVNPTKPFSIDVGTFSIQAFKILTQIFSHQVTYFEH